MTMSEPIITPSHAWLNAKDNWLGEGAFRPAASDDKSAPPKRAASDKNRPAPPPAYSEVYFAGG
jgi:hypothetical protein